MKLVIINQSQLSERWIKYFCLDDLSKVFDLEYWDCSLLGYPSFTVAHPLQRDYLRVINNLQELKKSISCLPKDTVFINQVNNNSTTYPIHKIFGRFSPYKAYVNFHENNINAIWTGGTHNRSKNPIRHVKDILYRSTFVRSFAKWLFHRHDPDYYENRMKRKCADCYKGCFYMSSVKGAEHRVNHPDFENYLSLLNEDRLLADKYVVFIDDFYPYHQEAFEYGKIVNVDEIAVEYYQTMNAFFDYVESSMKCKIVIAAHPSANYLERNPFHGRDIFYGETGRLIKDCEAVCMHVSNAFSYVALFNKPIAVISNAPLKISVLDYSTRLFGEKFGLPVLNTDDKQSYPHQLFQRIDEKLRLRYMDDYLGDLSTHRSNKELFVNYLREFHDNYLA